MVIAIVLVLRNRPYDAAIFIVGMVVAAVSLTVLKNIFQITRPGSGFPVDCQLSPAGWVIRLSDGC